MAPGFEPTKALYEYSSGRTVLTTGAIDEALAGHARAVRVGNYVAVSGIVATTPSGDHVGEGNAFLQAQQILRIIEETLKNAGSSLGDVVRTRIYLKNTESDWRAVGNAHSNAFGKIRPATTVVHVEKLMAPWMLVQIEADAVLQEAREEREREA